MIERSRTSEKRSEEPWTLTLIFKTMQMWFWNVLTAKSYERPGGDYSIHVTFCEILAFCTLARNTFYDKFGATCQSKEKNREIFWKYNLQGKAEGNNFFFLGKKKRLKKDIALSWHANENVHQFCLEKDKNKHA